ncbi:hypothetical protein ABIB80_004571 [Bradyrhizobium sp. i1.15.2]
MRVGAIGRSTNSTIHNCSLSYFLHSVQASKAREIPINCLLTTSCSPRRTNQSELAQVDEIRLQLGLTKLAHRFCYVRRIKKRKGCCWLEATGPATAASAPGRRASLGSANHCFMPLRTKPKRRHQPARSGGTARPTCCKQPDLGKGSVTSETRIASAGSKSPCARCRDLDLIYARDSGFWKCQIYSSDRTPHSITCRKGAGLLLRGTHQMAPISIGVAVGLNGHQKGEAANAETASPFECRLRPLQADQRGSS